MTIAEKLEKGKVESANKIVAFYNTDDSKRELSEEEKEEWKDLEASSEDFGFSEES